MTCDRQFWIDQLNSQKAIAAQYITAITAISTGKVQEASFNSGQTSHTVKKKNLKEYQDNLDGILDSIATLETRIYGCGVGQGRPGW